MIRTALSVVAGYAAIAILVIATDAVIGGVAHGDRRTFTVINLVVALPYGLLGGYLTARIARPRELAATIGLAALAIVMSLVTLAVDRGHQPLWYWGALLALMLAGVFCGGHLSKRQAVSQLS